MSKAVEAIEAAKAMTLRPVAFSNFEDSTLVLYLFLIAPIGQKSPEHFCPPLNITTFSATYRRLVTLWGWGYHSVHQLALSTYSFPVVGY